MKINFLIIGLILVLFLSMGFAAIPDVTQVNYDPNPAVPGSTITVLIQIENLDNSDKKDVTVSIEDDYPFTAVEGNVKNIGNMDARGKTLTQFKIYIDPTAQNQTYQLPIKVTEDGTTSGKITNFPIVVSGNEPNIRVINISESRLVPGEEKELSFEIQNIGTTTAYDIAVELIEDRTVTATGVVVEREITPLGSALGYIESLNPKEKANVTIQVSVNRSAELKNYTLPITVSYRTPAGERTTQTSYLGFKIAGKVLIDAALKENIVLIAGTTNEVSIELFNKGNGIAEFTIVTVNASFGEIDRAKQFIGSLEPNDVDSFKTNITIPANIETQDGEITLTIVYQDIDASTQTQTISLPVKVYSTADGAALNPIEPIGIIINIIILIVIVVIIWKVYKKVKKR